MSGRRHARGHLWPGPQCRINYIDNDQHCKSLAASLMRERRPPISALPRADGRATSAERVKGALRLELQCWLAFVESRQHDAQGLRVQDQTRAWVSGSQHRPHARLRLGARP